MSVTGDMLDDNLAAGYENGRASRDAEVDALAAQIATLERLHDEAEADVTLLKAALVEALDIATGPPIGYAQVRRIDELRKLAEEA